MPRPRTVTYPHVGVFAAEPPAILTVDGAIPIDRDRTFSIEKGSAFAGSIAAPGEANVGRELTFINGSAFAHVLTFTGTTLEDGTAGLNTTYTMVNIAGCAITVVARSATRWSVKSLQLGTVAP